MTVWVRLLPCLLFRHALQFFRIANRRGDSVGAAGPFSQVDQAAAVAAERKVLTSIHHQCAAGGATKGPYFVLRHKQLDVSVSANDPRHQIVIMRLGNLAAIEGARHEFLVVAKIVDEQLAVNLRSMHLGAAFPQQVCLF